MAPKQMLAVVAACAWLRGASGAVTLAARIAAGECTAAAVGEGSSVFELGNRVQPDPSMAQLFSITYGATFKVVGTVLAKEQYVLTQCGQARPTDAQVQAVAELPAGYTRKHFEVPLQSAIAMSTVQLAFLDALGVQDRVVYIDKYATAPCWQKALACGSTLGGNATVLAEQKASVDAVFMSCASNCSNVQTMANAVHVPVAQDYGPLQSAEYVKFMGAFFNKEPLANDLFAACKVAYQQAASGASTQPVVAWISYVAPSAWGAEGFVLSQAAYKLDMVKTAGGKNVDGAEAMAQVTGTVVSDAVYKQPAAGKSYVVPVSAFGSKSATAAAFAAALGSVDMVVDETYVLDTKAYSFESFLSNFGLTGSSPLKFVRDKMVLRYDGTLSASNGWDWFESRLANPQWAVEGLARQLHSDSSKRFKYFRNIAKGEKPEVLDESMCAKTLPVCVAGARPAPIVVLDAVEVGAARRRSLAPAVLLAAVAALPSPWR